jgi:arylsulfatase A-like enzyme
VDLIRELELERDTVLIITSDNGAHRGEEKGFDFFRSNGALRGEKGELYEGGIRVPFIVRWPRHVASGSATAHVTAFCDVLPTLSEIAGAEAPSGLDGISIVSALTGGKQRQHEYLYWEHNTYDQQTGKLRDPRLAQAVRIGDWKAVRVTPASPVEVYNLRSDPAEQTDLAKTKPEIVRQAQQLMKTARTEPRPHNTGSMKFVS